MRRTCATILVGLLGAIFIWVATPVNNLLLGNAFISDDYLPVGAAFVMLVLVLGINPLLCRWAPRDAFTGKQFALVFGILLIASVTPGQGLLRQLPYSLARSVQRVSQEAIWAERYEAMNPPAALFPGTLAHDAKVPAADKLLDSLGPGESIPWRAWLAPLLAWSGLLVPLWALGIVVGLVLFALLITRLVAETGLPLIAPGIGGVYHFISILPVAWRTAASMFFAGIGGFLATQANRVCAATVAIHALGLDPDAAPKKQTRVALLLLIVLILSLVVCGGVHLMVGYNFDTMLNGSGTQISGDYGIWAMLGDADKLLARWHTGNVVDPGPGNGMFILYGALLALVLYVLCLSSPKWPLRPVALVFCRRLVRLAHLVQRPDRLVSPAHHHKIRRVTRLLAGTPHISWHDHWRGHGCRHLGCIRRHTRRHGPDLPGCKRIAVLAHLEIVPLVYGCVPLLMSAWQA
jgi:hypothetical protein